MQRYPTHRGLALPVTELGYEVVSESAKRTQGHHLYFEREWYSAKRYRHMFRNLVGHVVRMRPVDHQELHNRYGPPAMPTDSFMIDYLDEHILENGLIVCHKERKLRETYQVMPQEWQGVKNDYRTRTY